ncbi:MAG: phosphoribosyltransferase, partial [Candidatus Babeliales bacterium]
ENSKYILIVDDLVDTGETMKFLIEALKDSLPKTTIKIATLYYKPTSCIKPDYYIEETTNWIVFPWEK